MIQLIALAALLAAHPAYHRDWVAHPAIVERAAPETICALGDIHGDYDRLLKLLAAAKLISANGTQWTGGKNTLVVTGDMIDKGPRPVEVLRLMMRLQFEAKQAGGEVIALAGNHEAEFLAEPNPKKNGDFIAELRANHYDPAQVASCHADLGEFLCGLPFGARVGEFFFSHGGNSAGQTLAGLSDSIVRGVDKDGFGTSALSAPDSLLEARLGEGKVSWIGLQNEAKLLRAYADALGVQHIVQGHQHNEIKFSDGAIRHAGQLFCYQGLLCLIDVGMSEGVDDSHGAILRISPLKPGLQFEAIYPDPPFIRPL